MFSTLDLLRPLRFAIAGFLLLSCSETDFPTPGGGAAAVDEIGGKEIRYLALGDSYTIGESVAPSERWPVLLAERLGTEAGLSVPAPEIIARTGWTTGNLSRALNIADLRPEYDLVSLLIGVNNQFQGRSLEEYKQEFAALLERAVALAGGEKRHVFVVSIPDYGYTRFGAGNQEMISARLAPFNAACRAISEAQGVAYYDITPISQQGLEIPGYVAADGLHPSGAQYAAWVAEIYGGVLAQVAE